MKIDIWSDVVCPFCYIGKRKLEQALESFPYKNEVEIQWHSFLLMPDAEYVPGMTINELLATRKHISIDRAHELNNHVTKVAAEVGLKFNFDIAKPANTFDAHRLIHFAAKYKLQSEMKERLMLAYFTQGENVSDRETLVRLATEVGLDAKEVSAMLKSKDMVTEVTADLQEAEDFRIGGVPFFVLNRKYAVSGAQPVSVFTQALTQAWDDWKKNQPLETIADGPSCKPGEPC